METQHTPLYPHTGARIMKPRPLTLELFAILVNIAHAVTGITACAWQTWLGYGHRPYRLNRQRLYAEQRKDHSLSPALSGTTIKSDKARLRFLLFFPGLISLFYANVVSAISVIPDSTYTYALAYVAPYADESLGINIAGDSMDATATESVIVSASSGGRTADASAQTTFGYNHAKASGSNPRVIHYPEPTDRGSSGEARSIYWETWTITDPFRTGESAQGRLGATINGYISDPSSFYWSAQYHLTTDPEDQTNSGSYTPVSAIYDWDIPFTAGQLTGTFWFTYGDPFIVESELYVQATGLTVDFSGTAALTFIELPEGATLITGSGTTYPVNYPVSTPVPAAIYLFASGIVAFAGTLIRRKR